MECGSIGFLGICAVYDAYTKTIPGWLFWVFGCLAVVIRLWQGSFFSLEMACSVLPGLLFWGLAKCTDSIGEGDGLMLLVLGMYMHMGQLLGVSFGAFLLSAILSAVCLITKKGNFRTEIPFAPFLFAAYGIYKVVEIIGS